MPRKPRPWFRFYTEMPTDRKIRRLTPAQRWLWCCILAAARESPKPGWLLVADGVPMSARDLADYADVPTRSIRVGIELMESLGMVTMKNGALFVLNFESRQFESDDVTARTRAHRQRHVSQDQGVLDGVGTFPPVSLERSNGVPTGDVGTFLHRQSRDNVGTDQRQRQRTEPLTSVDPGGEEPAHARDATRCARHPQGNPTDQPCRGCAAANKARDQADARARADARRARETCPDCHGNIWLDNGTKCTHPHALRAIEGANP